MLADLGLARSPHPDHAAYCALWVPLLRADPRALNHAAAQGSRAADYLTALQLGSWDALGTRDEERTPAVPHRQPHRAKPALVRAPRRGAGHERRALVSRRVLDALHPGTAGSGLACESSTPAARAFVRLETALDAHKAALAALDRIEAAIFAAHGYPSAPLPDTGGPPAYAADPATYVRRLGPGPAGRGLTTELRRLQAVFARAGS